MKTAIYVEDGVVQLVITPENDFEKNALNSFSVSPMEAKIYSGSFYDCRGGWVRKTDYSDRSPYGWQSTDDKSLIITMRKEAGETA